MGEDISSQERNLYLLKILADSSQALTASDFLQITSFSKSTLYRQLAYLKRWNLICEFNGKYYSGATALKLGEKNQIVRLIKSLSQEALKYLNKRTEETVAISILQGNQVFCIHMLEGLQALRCSIEMNRTIALNRGATAKSLLSQINGSKQSDMIRSMGGSRQDQSNLIKELSKVRKNGYATSEGQLDEGIWGVSVPLMPFNGVTAYSCISLMAPISRAKDNKERFINETQIAAKMIAQSAII